MAYRSGYSFAVYNFRSISDSADRYLKVRSRRSEGARRRRHEEVDGAGLANESRASKLTTAEERITPKRTNFSSPFSGRDGR
jgi:hypothetical protein